MIINNQEIHGFLREVGKPLRETELAGQISPRLRFSTVTLGNRTLYDLVPGMLHAVSVDSLEDYGLYVNERDL
jgi:hypothetical protein